MLTVNVFYRRSDSIKFDMDYYFDTHLPLLQKRVGSALQDVVVQRGIAGGTPGSAPEFEVIVLLRFASMEAFQAAFVPHAPEIRADVKNFSNVEPIIQFSDVRLA